MADVLKSGLSSDGIIMNVYSPMSLGCMSTTFCNIAQAISVLDGRLSLKYAYADDL